MRSMPLPSARALLVALLTILALAAPARALVQIDINEGNVRPLPIAIAPFEATTGVGAELASIVEADLRSSGLFAPIDPNAFVQQDATVDAAPRFADWTVIDAEALAVGRVSTEADGRLRVDFRLWDTFAGEQMIGQQFYADSDNYRRVAHIIADAIYERLTGEKGYFDTRIVFVDETGPKENRKKRLAIMDQDGANVRYLTNGADLVMTPRFAPERQEVTYMSFAGGQPKVYLLQLETGQREIVGNFPSMTFAPRFSPDGSRVVMSLQQGGNANIYAMDLRTRATMRLTDSAAIDTSPSYSPDGQQIVFESDRGGAQQLYVMGADGSNAQRISFGNGRYSTPVWSPRGDLIAFTKQSADGFSIGVMRPDGSGERVLTTGFHNEGPTWAPNGRTLMFFRDQGQGPELWAIDVTGRNERRIATPAFASDPAWSPRMN